MANIQPRQCKICGQTFQPASSHQIYCKNLHYRICPVCGKSYPEPNLDKFKKPPTTCSMECRVLKREQTSMSKYGIKAPGNNPDAREKSKKTMLSRYGVEHAQSSEAIHKKSIATYIERYGVDNPQKNETIKGKTAQTNLNKYGSKSYLNSEEGKNRIDNIMLEKYGTITPLRNESIRQQWIATNIEKYGADNPAKTPEVRDKMKRTSLLKYGTEYPQSSEIVKQHIRDTFIRNYGVDNCFKAKDIIDKIKVSFYKRYSVHSVMEAEEVAARIRETNMKRYGVPYYVMLPNVSRSSGRISRINRQIRDKLNDAGMDARLEFPIERYSYDIYVPQGNTLIEIDPAYTHSTVGNHWNPKGIDAKYHLNKTLTAINHGYRCLHLWDWDSVSKFINLLTTKHTIYTAAHPEILAEAEASEFIGKYSLYNISQNLYGIIFIGLRYKSKLMTVMGFKLSDALLKTWEIVCIENRFHYIIYNGNKAILDYFIANYSPNKIMAYADFSKSNGEILENLGFEYNRFVLPNKIWSKGRHAIVDDSSIIPESMLRDNWLPVYNCGYKVYEKYPI